MPQDHSFADVAALRGAVARIEAGRSGAPRRRGASGPPPVGLGDGALPLDAALGGGLRRGALHEIVAESARDAAAAAGFALAVAGRCAGPAPLVWIVEDHAAAETGLPYRPGLAAHGIDTDRLILVRTADGPSTLWALEEALRLGAPAVLAELWGAKRYGLVTSRRLLLAAQGGRGVAVLLHAGLAGRGGSLSSAAETRLSVAACPSPHLASAGNRVPIPGPAAVAVRILKLRLGGDADLDRDRSHPIVWNPHRRCFDAHPLPFGVPAPAADRPYPPRRAASVVPFGARAG